MNGIREVKKVLKMVNKKQLLLANLILFLVAIPAFASRDLKQDYFKEPPKEAFQGSKDNNNDGKPDEMYYKKGNKELLIEDTDFDGNKDAVTYYEDEVLIKKEVDIDKDGEWDYRYWYKDGEFDRMEKVSD